MAVGINGVARGKGSRSKLERIPPSVRQEIVSRIREGVPFIVAAESCGIARRTWARWMERGREDGAREPYKSFAVECDRAFADWQVAAVRQVAVAGAKDWRAPAHMLERRAPEHWADPSKGNLIIHNYREDPEVRGLLVGILERLAAHPAALAAVVETLPAGIIEGHAVEMSDEPE
jgi:hypothetical protein